MKCPRCAHGEDRVIDSRPADDGAAIRRRRECLSCGYRFTTYEKIELPQIFVVKKDGSREPFNREKLMNGLIKACEKRPVTPEQMDQIIATVENAPRNKLGREIRSVEIGQIVLQELRHIDEVAYVRFASVYREFVDVRSFLQELQTLLTDNEMTH